MSLKKILMKGTTRMSLHERFTFLRNQSVSSEPPQRVHPQAVRQGLFQGRQQASAKNRRLAQAMERRPTVMAALRFKKNILKQRLGQVQRISVKERLNLRGRGAIQGRVGQRAATGRSPLVRQIRPLANWGGRGRENISRFQSVRHLSRSQSMQSLNSRQNLTTPTVRGRGGFPYRNTYGRQQYRRGGSSKSLQSRGGGYIKTYDDYRNRRGGGGSSNFNNRRSRARGFRSHGGGRGRGGGRPVPTKEELDNQLDQYMAGSRGALDRELDTYMSQQETWN